MVSQVWEANCWEERRWSVIWGNSLWGCPNIPQSPAELEIAVHSEMLNIWGQTMVFLVVDSHQPNSTH